MTVTATSREVELRGAARRLLSCRDGEVVVSGPAGTGKSVGGLYKLHLAMMKYRNSRGMIARKTAASLGASTLDIWRKRVATDSLAIGEVVYYGGSTSEPPQYRYLRNGSTITIGGLDKPSKIMSTEYDMIIVDEATELFVPDWEALTSRLRSGQMPYAQIIGLCNPDAEHHWIYQRGEAGVLTMMESRHEDNPAYFDRHGVVTEAGAAYLARLDKLTGVRYWRLRKGLWVAAEGLIYGGWDPAHHLVDGLPKGSDTWVRWWSVDFGYRNPFVLQCWAEDPDGRLWLYREIYMTGRLVEDHARQILKIVAPFGKWFEPRPRAVICDHDAEDRATLERHLHMSTVAAYKAVTTGIEAVQARLRVAGDGSPRIFIVRDALVERDQTLVDAGKPTCTKEEMTGYVWAKGLDGRPVKEEPHKENDHGCLVAGTLVTTARGEVPIERIEAGDRVATRSGWRSVIAAGMTQVAAPVFAVRLSTGRTLVGTGDHPIWVADRGWIRLDALRYADTLLPWSRAFDSEESSSDATPSQRTGQSASTLYPESATGKTDGSAITKRSGARRMATLRSPRVTTSITSISSRRTTLSTISSASRAPSTRTCIESADVSAGRSEASPRLLNSQLLPGTVARRVEPGTLNTGRRLGRARSIARRSANNVVPNFRRVHAARSNASVQITASRRTGVTQALTTKLVAARSVPLRSSSTVTQKRRPAAVSVLSVCAQGTASVFNLTVDGAPEYYANGVLVHNCDAKRYVVAHRDLEGRPMIRVLRSRG